MTRFFDILKREGLVVDPDNRLQVIVADYWQEHVEDLTNKGIQWDKDIHWPCIAPPFENMCIEAKVRGNSDDVPEYIAALVSVFDGGGSPNTNPYGEDCKWVLFVDVAYMIRRIPILVRSGLVRINVSKDGSILNPINEVLAFHAHKSASAEDIEHALFCIRRIIPQMLFALNALNAVNVELIDVIPPVKLSKSHRKKYGHELTTYKELVVKSKEINLSQSSRMASGTNSAHQVRGHFKNRDTGTFWWNSHIRGKGDRIDKVYRIEE